jgi:hypothetical protein
MMQPDYFRYSYILGPLLKREDLAERFALMLIDMAVNVVTEQNVRNITGRLYAEAYREIGHSLAAGKFHEIASLEFFAENHENMALFAAGRPDYIKEVLTGYFGWDEERFAAAMEKENG